MKRAGRKRLSVDVPLVLHKELGEIAKIHHCTITMVVLRFLVEKCIAERSRSESDQSSHSSINDLSDLLPF